MDDWDVSSGFGEERTASPENPKRGAASNEKQTGGWHWVMTLVCFITVTALSFLMAFLTKDTINRPFWMIGAIFTVPTFGMFAAAMLVEQKTSAMTPNTSRKIQYLVALIAVVATFAVGCIFDLLYQQGVMGQIIKNWAENHPPKKVYSDIVLMVDKSASLSEDGKDAANREAIRAWLDDMDDDARIGLIVFNQSVTREIPIDWLANNRRRIENAMNQQTGGNTDFDVSLYHAFRMIDNAESSRAKNRQTQIIAITDAEAELSQRAMEEYAHLAEERNVAFSIVHIGQKVPADNPLMKLASSTGGAGTSIGMSDLASYFEGIQVAEEPDWNAYYHELRSNGEVDFDMIRVPDPTANLLCGLMLALEGLAIGLCLMLMLSLTGQKRMQPVTSVVMAGIAFALLKIIGPGSGPFMESSKLGVPQWLLEGMAFSLLGIVFMKKNNLRSAADRSSVFKAGPMDRPDDVGNDGSGVFSGGGFDDPF